MGWTGIRDEVVKTGIEEAGLGPERLVLIVVGEGDVLLVMSRMETTHFGPDGDRGTGIEAGAEDDGEERGVLGPERLVLMVGVVEVIFVLTGPFVVRDEDLQKRRDLG